MSHQSILAITKSIFVTFLFTKHYFPDLYMDISYQAKSVFIIVMFDKFIEICDNLKGIKFRSYN
jgi:hypothetical protein